jgi:NADPH:quinone reductase-like Zn-dependent oxidoreductase
VRIAVTGGRDHLPSFEEMTGFSDLWARLGGAVLLHGGARGVDSAMAQWGHSHGVTVETFPADWKKHGPGAGPIRNGEMVKTADALIAFEGGKGTADCIRRAQQRALPVFSARTGGPL